MQPFSNLVWPEKMTQQNPPSNSRLLLDFLPLAVFFIAYKLADILVATAALVVATLVSLLITYIREKTIAPTPLVSGVAVTVFGILTLWLNDETFIKVKPTIVNLLFAAILLVGVCFKKPLLKMMLGSALLMQEEGWYKLSIRWGVFFIFLAALNEYIWRSYSTEFWVDFKVFGMFTCTIVFTFLQIPLMQRYMIMEEDPPAN